MTNFVIDPETQLPIGLEVAIESATRPGETILDGRFVRLEPLDVSRHAAALHKVSHGQNSAALWLYMPSGPFPDIEAHKQHLEALKANPDFYLYVICDTKSGAVLGQASYMRIDSSNRSIEVGYILYSPALQRSAAATEAMYLMAKHVFEGLGYRRYEWKCNTLNAPSKSAALRLGFTYEGLFRQAVIVKGRNRDTAWYSMLDQEWPRCKAAFEKWLAADNFDGTGAQRQSLASFRLS